jgi:hypothetical protein
MRTIFLSFPKVISEHLQINKFIGNINRMLNTMQLIEDIFFDSNRLTSDGLEDMKTLFLLSCCASQNRLLLNRIVQVCEPLGDEIHYWKERNGNLRRIFILIISIL